ncbi:MAG: GntR family transcriptional regulator, partial [Planctomycetia bacterium]|nr:GntR family transcriptional regulator [Planctomycetia bacterium]
MTPPRRPKHQIIYESLAGEIGGGRLAPGQRLPTEVELVDPVTLHHGFAELTRISVRVS